MYPPDQKWIVGTVTEGTFRIDKYCNEITSEEMKKESRKKKVKIYENINKYKNIYRKDRLYMHKI